MKKSYLMMAAAATMLAACSQSDVLNEVQVQEEAQAIGFSTYAGKATRAENSTAENVSNLELHHGSFKVWGYKDTYTGFVFDNVRVTADGAGNWTYSPKKYWDKAATNYHFYAAAPDNGLWNLSTNSTAQDDDYFYINSFTLQGTSLEDNVYKNTFAAVNDCDLMIASPCVIDRSKYAASIPASKVQLEFNHILSRLNVTVNKGSNILGETLNVTSFKVYNLKNTGSFNEIAELNGDILTVGTNKRWTTTDATYEIAGYGLNDVAQNNAGNQYIFQSLVIPQPAGFESVDRAAESATAPYFIIEYTISGEPFKAAYNLSNAFGDDDGMVFCEGYQNTLHLTIDAETIVFDAQVYEWADKNTPSFKID